MLRYFSSWSALAVSTRPCQLPKLLSALTIAQRSLAQKGQKPAPMKNTSVLPLGRLSASSETCMNLPRTFRGMKLLLGLLLVLTTRKCSVVYLLMFGIRIISPDTQAIDLQLLPFGPHTKSFECKAKLLQTQFSQEPIQKIVIMQ